MLIRDIFLTYLPFSAMMVIIFIIELNRRLKRREDYLFVLSCFCVLGWIAFNLFMLLTDDIALINILYQCKLVFVAFFAVFLLFFMMKFYRVFDKVPRYGIILMLILPSLTAIVALTGHWHHLMVARFDVISLAPVRNFNISWGIWFWVHAAYSWIMAMATAVISLIYHFREPRFYRSASSFMVAGIVLTLFSNIITLSHIFPSFLDTTVIGASLSLFLFNKAIIGNDRSRFARYTRRQILHFLDEYIFVLDEKQTIVDANQPAAQWFLGQGISLTAATLQNITDVLMRRGKRVENDFHIENDPFPIVLNLRVHDLTDENNSVIGHIAVFTDVTQNRMLIERLEARAKMDTLTGLPNRGAYDGARKRLEAPVHLPLAVIVGDVNNLKEVNDTLGHQYGDMLLQKTAEVLERICPDKGFLARLGGDEFVFLLPRCSGEDAAVYTDKIKKEMSQRQDLPFTLSMALGSAIRDNAGQNLDDVIALADSLMYEDKKTLKEALP